MIFRNLAISLICVAYSVNSLRSRELLIRPIDSETFAAYEKLGAIYGGFIFVEEYEK
jgi:hypothetical protein